MTMDLICDCEMEDDPTAPCPVWPRTCQFNLHNVDLKLLHMKRWSTQSQGVVIFLFALTSNHLWKRKGDKQEKHWQAVWWIQMWSHICTSLPPTFL